MTEDEKNKPPKLPNSLLVKLIREGLVEEFQGDLQEIYEERLATKGKFYANFMYWVDALHLIFGFTVYNPFKNINNPTIMYQHYLKIASRNLFRNKVYSIINILSLGVGMGVCLLICQYVYFEKNFDNFHDNFQNTYRVIFDKTKNGALEGTIPYNGYKFGITAKEEIPEIEQFVRLYPAGYGAVVTNPDKNKPINEEAKDMFFVDTNFFKVFNFPLEKGSAESALAERFNIIITQNTANKYFGSADPMGKTLKITGGSSPGNYTVTGVLEELPANSHLQFEFLMPLENFWNLGNGGSVNRYDGWARIWFVTYFSMDASANLDLVKKKLDQLIVKYKGQWNDPENVVEKTRFQAIADIHLKSDAYAEADFVTNKGSIQDVSIFSMIAFFILFIAYVNYINLSTARSMHRAKEVGIRKAIGAFRKQLIGQFMLESVLVNLLATFLALLVAYFALPFLSHIIGKELEWSLLQIPLFWGWFIGIIFIGSLLSGIYPAFILSAFKPISILGGNKIPRMGNVNLRRGLIVFQFLISLLLLSGTYLVYKQITFMKNQELGMDLEKILILKGPKEIPNAPKVTDGRNMTQILAYQAVKRSTFQAFKEEVSIHPSISGVTGSHVIPGQVNNISIKNLQKFGQPESEGKYGRWIYTGLDFLKTYDLELIAGNSFTVDLSEDNFVIINEEAARVFDLGTPEEAVQEKLLLNDKPTPIIGVVKNFHWESLRAPHTPYILRFSETSQSYISFKMNLSNIPESLAHIEATYKAVYPNNPFEYFFLEDKFNQQYQADLQFRNLFFAFTALAIFIACIGLFALISFSATLRIKEIGIRKVLGASTSNLMLLLSKEYFVLLGIAIFLALPASFYWGGIWLENYAFRTVIGFDLFLIPALVLVLISFLTVSYRTYATARANPVESLKAE